MNDKVQLSPEEIITRKLREVVCQLELNGGSCQCEEEVPHNNNRNPTVLLWVKSLTMNLMIGLILRCNIQAKEREEK